MNTNLHRSESAIIAERRIQEHHDRPRRWLQPGPWERDEGRLILVVAQMEAVFVAARAKLDAIKTRREN